MSKKPFNFFVTKKKDLLRRKNFSLVENYSFVSSILSDANAVQPIKKSRNIQVMSKVSIRNRCLVTGRAKSVFSKFRISRLVFRDLALFGFIPGVKKASW